jgi:magnesium transporter
VIIDRAVYEEGHRLDAGAPRTERGFAWVGTVEPTDDELSVVAHDFGLDDFDIERARHLRQRPRIDARADHTYMFVRTASYDPGTERVVMGDLAVFLAEGWIVTVRHGEALPLQSVRSDLEADPGRLAGGPTVVLVEVLGRLVQQYVEVAEKLREDVEDIEDLVFDDEIPAPSTKLYSVKREVVEFRRAVLPLLEPLQQVATDHVAHVSTDHRQEFAHVHDNLRRVIDEVEVLSALMDAALGANLTLVQVRQNADMRRISAWVGIAAVPTMVAGLYGMNFEHMPELGMRYSYFVVLGALASASLGLFRLFRRYDWL